VIDHQRDQRHEQKSGGEKAGQQPPREGMLHIPDRQANWLPEPHEQNQGHIGDEHIDATLDRVGDHSRPDALEGWAGHDGMLQAEEHEQDDVHE
jgi:hypothetical protein